MQKFFLLILAFLPLQIFAISYNSSSSYTMPNVVSNTWLLLFEYNNADFTNLNYDNASGSYRVMNFVTWVRYRSGYTMSGELMNWFFQQNTSESNVWVKIFIEPTITWHKFRFSVLEWVYPGSLITQWDLLFIDWPLVCPWLTGDCIFIFKPQFVWYHPTVWGWLYFPYIDILLYSDDNNNVSQNRIYFWNSIGENPDTLDTFLSFFTGFSDKLWILMNYRTYNPNYTDVQCPWTPNVCANISEWWYNPYYIFGYTRINSPIADKKPMADFLLWVSTGTQLTRYLPEWLWVNNTIVYNSNNTWSINIGGGTGTTNTGSIINTDSWFDSCTSFLEVWCYIKSAFSGATNALFPNISFNGSFDSCDFEMLSMTWWYMQKFANIIAVLNPIPPLSGSTLCMLYSTGIVTYQRIIPEENFFQHYVPWALPQVENIETKVFWQSIFDIIVIFAMIALLFYTKNH